MIGPWVKLNNNRSLLDDLDLDICCQDHGHDICYQDHVKVTLSDL